jgi:primary-amine oxidase
MAKRMAYASHHLWITRHRDGEFWAAGRFTNQSSVESGGVKDMIERNENIENEDLVIWHSFGLTHNPRVEDFPVMPIETHQIHLKPADFFTKNPAIDVPSTKNQTSILYKVGGLVSGFVAEVPQNNKESERTRQAKLVTVDDSTEQLAQGIKSCCI